MCNKRIFIIKTYYKISRNKQDYIRGEMYEISCLKNVLIPRLTYFKWFRDTENLTIKDYLVKFVEMSNLDLYTKQKLKKSINNKEYNMVNDIYLLQIS